MVAKTVKEYMSDPRILNDPEMRGAPEAIREIHAIRLKHQDETAGMTPEEHAAYVNKKAAAFLARSGITPGYADFSRIFETLA
ncbi:MAG: hypothetical protein LBQ38_05345 [Spirochaetaceae bacterium]|jgi:hypothetical protein|nr:hypothetical protein [Spirochaetaceae bacterium]